MAKCKKILEEIHPLSIIQEVEKWPVLYVKDNPDRANSHFKNKVWHEIAKTLFTDWDGYSDIEKECKISDLNKKWRNLRDTFKRQLETEKKIREGHEIKKKPYVYFKHMLYLLPHITNTDDTVSDPDVEPRLNEFFKKSKRKVVDNKKNKVKKTRSHKHVPLKSVIISETSSKSIDSEELIDEDKHFLMSLIPSFKRMSDDEKLEAKVKILKVIKGIRKNTQNIPDSVEYSNVAVSLYNLEDGDYSAVKTETITSNSDDLENLSVASESEKSENSN